MFAGGGGEGASLRGRSPPEPTLAEVPSGGANGSTPVGAASVRARRATRGLLDAGFARAGVAAFATCAARQGATRHAACLPGARDRFRAGAGAEAVYRGRRRLARDGPSAGARAGALHIARLTGAPDILLTGSRRDAADGALGRGARNLPRTCPRLVALHRALGASARDVAALAAVPATDHGAAACARAIDRLAGARILAVHLTRDARRAGHVGAAWSRRRAEEVADAVDALASVAKRLAEYLGVGLGRVARIDAPASIRGHRIFGRGIRSGRGVRCSVAPGPDLGGIGALRIGTGRQTPGRYAARGSCDNKQSQRKSKHSQP